MYAVVFAKSNSKRVPNKNFRDFHEGQSLLDIALDKIPLERSQIFVSSESPEKLEPYHAKGYRTLFREEQFTFNETPITDVLRDAEKSLPQDDRDVMFAMPCDPLLQSLVYRDICYTWHQVRDHGYDSLGLVVPRQEHVLDSNYRPQGFGFGYGHKPSQELPVTYRVNFSVSIVKRQVFRESEPYHFVGRPFWYHVDGPSVDIDTMSDFRAAQALYAAGV